MKIGEMIMRLWLEYVSVHVFMSKNASLKRSGLLNLALILFWGVGVRESSCVLDSIFKTMNL